MDKFWVSVALTGVGIGFNLLVRVLDMTPWLKSLFVTVGVCLIVGGVGIFGVFALGAFGVGVRFPLFRYDHQLSSQNTTQELPPLPGYDRLIPARSSREGREEGFERSSHVWFASIAGARLKQITDEDLGKIRRVLLIEPGLELMKVVAEVQGERGKDFPEEVRKAVKFCKSEEVKALRKGKEIEVRLSSTPIQNVTLFDPGTPHAWARVQEFIPYYRGPGALVYAIREEEWGGKDGIYSRIEDSFEQAWKNGRDPIDIN